jgi:CRISPR-associated endonuclease/helicase Cas3
MKPSLYPDWMDHIWAKSPDKGEGGQAESLAQHTWAVLERLTEFIRLRPGLPDQLGHADLWHMLYWSAFFHDFGKAVPAFQSILRAESGGRERWGKHRHEVFSLAFLAWVANDLTSDQTQWITAAIVSHHRDPSEINCLYSLPEEGEEDILDQHIRELSPATLQNLWHWIAECSPVWITALRLDSLGVRPLVLAPKEDAVKLVQEQGVRNIRSSLRMYRKFIRTLDEQDTRFLVGTITLRGHIINADHGGSAHAQPLPAVRFLAQDVIEKRKLDPKMLFAHQQRSGETVGSALLVAPTGSGKTEAALLWAARQNANGIAPPRLFYTLPYQASMNAMNIRLGEIFGNENIGLQHGRGLLALYRQLMERQYTPAYAAYTARQMKNMAKLNHPPVRVFSPYQMLKAMYRLKGYEAQLMDYHNALFIFDEIHAYEVGRLAMILKTIEYLRRYYNASFFVMSATFPSLIKNWLKDALGDTIEINADPALFQEFQRHQLIVMEGDLLSPEHMQLMATEARMGKSVLVVCNIVARAQQAYNVLQDQLRDTNIPVELLHGRFNMRDRMLKENKIREKTGTRSEKRSPVVLVATQVVEVSLDIDLNVIYSDPAPLEALVQRFGRINRGRKVKPFAPVNVFTQPDDGQKIYDPELIKRTLSILRRENGKPIDENKIGTWLDEIYEGEIAQQWQQEYRKVANEFESVCVNTLHPFETADENLEDSFSKMFDGVEVLPDALFQEYESKRETEPIAANELLVPMRWGQYHMLMKKNLIKPGDKMMPPIVMSDYTSELGLTFDKQPKADDWD